MVYPHKDLYSGWKNVIPHKASLSGWDTTVLIPSTQGVDNFQGGISISIHNIQSVILEYLFSMILTQCGIMGYPKGIHYQGGILRYTQGVDNIQGGILINTTVLILSISIHNIKSVILEYLFSMILTRCGIMGYPTGIHYQGRLLRYTPTRTDTRGEIIWYTHTKIYTQGGRM